MKTELTLDELGPEHAITYNSAGPLDRRIEGRFTPIEHDKDVTVRRWPSPKDALVASAALKIMRLSRARNQAQSVAHRLRMDALLWPAARAARRGQREIMAEKAAAISELETFVEAVKRVQDPYDFDALNMMIGSLDLDVDEIVPAPETFRFKGGFIPVGTRFYGVRFDHFGAPRMLEGKVTGFEAADTDFMDGPLIYFSTEMDRGDSAGKIDTHRTILSNWVPEMSSEAGHCLSVHGHLFFFSREHAVACALSKVDPLMEDLRELRHRLTA